MRDYPMMKRTLDGEETFLPPERIFSLLEGGSRSPRADSIKALKLMLPLYGPIAARRALNTIENLARRLT